MQPRNGTHQGQAQAVAGPVRQARQAVLTALGMGDAAAFIAFADRALYLADPAFISVPAFFACASPSPVRLTSTQPVNLFCRFHSLWPWRTRTMCVTHRA